MKMNKRIPTPVDPNEMRTLQIIGRLNLSDNATRVLARAVEYQQIDCDLGGLRLSDPFNWLIDDYITSEELNAALAELEDKKFICRISRQGIVQAYRVNVDYLIGALPEHGVTYV